MAMRLIIHAPDQNFQSSAFDLTGFFWTRRYESIELEGRKKMPNKKFNAEQIVKKLRQVELLLAQGKTIAIALYLMRLIAR